MRGTLLSMAVLALAACSGTPPVPDAGFQVCPQDLPPDCPSTPPSYAHDVAPLIQAHCLACHAPGGQSADKPLGTYNAVFSRRGEVLNQVYACVMPPAGQPSLSSTERQTLLSWLVCGAPNN
jgi:hypothetical protein